MNFPSRISARKEAPTTSFSGKKKKQQLQEKRQRKREAEERQIEHYKLEESIREALAAAHPGEEVTLEMVETAKAEYYAAHGGCDADGKARGRREKRRQRKGEGADKGDGEDKGDNEEGAHRAAKDQARDDEEYVYDAHGRGVRSAFKRESAAVLAARRRLNFMPLAGRQFMDGRVGIPFGRWFVMPRRVGDGTEVTQRTQKRDDGGADADGDGDGDAEEQENEAKPLVSADGIGSSLCFPFSLDLPSRGWAPRQQGGATSANTAGVAFDILSNETVLPATKADEAAGPRDADSAEEAEEGGDDEGSESSSDSHDGDAHGSGEKKNRVNTVEMIEETRFRAYLKCVEDYPLPGDLKGLAASSCERNVEVWRQLWRTIESCDVNVVVADARYPTVHTHLGLLSYLTRKECKPCVLVLNKSDLVPQSVMECWLNFLPLYLTSLGLLTLAPDDAVRFMAANPPAELRRAGKAAPIVIQTFTADPSKDTAVGADADANVGRRRGAKQRRAKMYEQLRAGHLNVAKDLDGDDDADEMHSEDETAYDPSVNFKGKEKAERNMQAGQREFRELKIVSNMITDLLATCRSLAPAGKGAAKTSEQPSGTDKGSDAEGKTKKKSAPIAAPMKKGKKGQKKKRGKRSTSASSHDDSNSSINSEHGTDSDDDILETREDDDEAYIHIGFIGYPNVGKSSLLNCIRGTKVVSVSPTPGHTKHLQTIPVPSEGVTLVDSPGLVAPCYGLPKPLEAVLGTHQIAQTRDPQSGIAYLASHLPLEKIYGLRRPEDADADEEWSAYELCEAYARKRGYFVKHGKGTLDVHRAAIAILQEAYQGRLTLYFAPPELNYLQSKHYKEKVQPNLLLRVFAQN